MTVISHTLSVATSTLTFHKVQDIIDCNCFSKLDKLLKVTTAYVLRFVPNPKNQRASQSLHNDNVQKFKDMPSINEITVAEHIWIKSVQTDFFLSEKEFLASKSQVVPRRVNQFELFMEREIMKCQGKIDNSTLPLNSKRPILPPSHHPFVDLLIRQYHERSKHGGVNDTLMMLRERYWILKGRRSVKRVVKNCVVCLKCKGTPYNVTSTPDLPTERVSDDPPFIHLGVDFAGPLYIKRDAGDSKVYVCLFTCAATRAVHLEMTNLLSADSFLLAFG